MDDFEGGFGVIGDLEQEMGAGGEGGLLVDAVQLLLYGLHG